VRIGHLTFAVRLALGLVAVFVVSAGAWAAEVTFSGVLVTGGKVHVILIDAASGRSSGWIQAGQSFEQCTMIRYESASETLIVSSGGEERSLPLIGVGKIKSPALKFKVRGREYQIYADSHEKDGARIVFRGRVTGMSDGAHFSCDELTADTERESMKLVGSVRFQRGNSLATARILILE
jgi:hypothetical protein